MKRNLQIIILQSILVLLMSALVSYTLLPLVDQKYYALFFVFGVLTVIGFITVIFPGIGPFPFGIVVFLTTIPAILEFNLLDLGIKSNTIFDRLGLEYPGYYHTGFSPGLPFVFILGLGLFIIAGYFALSYLNTLQIDYRKSLAGEAEKSEIEIITSRNIKILFVFLAASIVFSAITTVILRVVQSPVIDWLNNYSWAVPVFGLSGILVLAGFLYWTGSVKSRKTQ